MGFACNTHAFTINDMSGVVGWLWTWPGDWFLSNPKVQTFLEMEPRTIIGSGWSYLFGVLVLVYIAFIIALIQDTIATGVGALGRGPRRRR